MLSTCITAPQLPGPGDIGRRSTLGRAASLLILAAGPLAAQTTDADGLRQALAVPTTSMVAAHLDFLADDMLEGRAPGTRGADIAARYIRAQMREAGLEPGAPDGTFFQSLRLVGVTPSASMVVGVAQRTMALRHLDDFVAWPLGAESAVIADGDIVFVGHGIVAPEWRRDDYQSGTLAGKILMVLVNDPGLTDPSIFEGRTMTYYGDWKYKIEQADRVGAAGVILIHTNQSAPFSWSFVRNTWSGEQLRLDGTRASGLRFGAWMSEDAARRVIGATGIDFELLMRRVGGPDFRPIPIGAHVVMDINSSIRSIESVNVIGKLPGSGEAETPVVLTAHYDHRGIRRPVRGDSIYNGAVDNASGVAALLATAAGLARAGPTPRNSVYFIATTAGEGGFLGAKTYLRTPPAPLARTAAVVNIDGANVWGATSDIVALGAERSTLGEIAAAAAAAEGLALVADPLPEAGRFFGSDHFPFARAGIPAVSMATGPTFRDRPADWGRLQAQEFLASRYHQPGDAALSEYRYEGLLQQVAVMIRMGWALAQNPEIPSWNADSPYADAGERLRAGR